MLRRMPARTQRRGMCPRAGFVALVTVLAVQTAAPRAVIPDWQTAKPYTAVVSATEGNFVFELPGREEWEWRLPETRLAGLEFEWTVRVRRSNDRGFLFGFFFFNFPRQQPSNGGLGTLLQQGQWTVGEGSQIAGAVHLQKPMKVQGIASLNRLVLTISDPTTLQTIFSDQPGDFSERPVEATFTTRVAGQPAIVRTVPIVYR
jgi:hypothetical protein